MRQQTLESGLIPSIMLHGRWTGLHQTFLVFHHSVQVLQTCEETRGVDLIISVALRYGPCKPLGPQEWASNATLSTELFKTIAKQVTSTFSWYCVLHSVCSYAVLGHHLSQYAPPHHGLCQHTVHPKPQKRSGASSSRKTVILQRNLGIYNSNLTGSVCIASMKVYTSLGARTIPRCFMCPAKLFGSIFLAEICAWLFDAAWYDSLDPTGPFQCVLSC